jgi:hypothetical protein
MIPDLISDEEYEARRKRHGHGYPSDTQGRAPMYVNYERALRYIAKGNVSAEKMAAMARWALHWAEEQSDLGAQEVLRMFARLQK